MMRLWLLASEPAVQLEVSLPIRKSLCLAVLVLTSFMELCKNKMKLILLYDAENVGGGTNRAKSIHQHLIEQGFELETVVVCSKSNLELSRFHEYFSQSATTICRLARGGKDSADIILATIAGFFLGQSLHKGRGVGVALASEDKKLALCLNEWITHDYKAYLLINGQRAVTEYQAINPSIMIISYELSKRRPVSRERLFNYNLYPYIYSPSLPPSLDCLEVISLPTSLEPIPKFIPLPLVGGELSIGASLGCDIDTVVKILGHANPRRAWCNASVVCSLPSALDSRIMSRAIRPSKHTLLRTRYTLFCILR